jgi:hypothetical protein
MGREILRYMVDNRALALCENKALKVLRVMDLSARGAGVYSDSPLPVRQEVNVTIEPSSFLTRTIVKRALVAWSREVSPRLWRSGLDFGEDNKLDFPLQGPEA